ncbi:MAG: EF-hand domain-containing protein [Gallionella sp.]|nr:EF-hand domain-containing protein [Gallionella sp.]MCK9355367.1 EF-hand domain-containing protein [Gallionella sp.]
MSSIGAIGGSSNWSAMQGMQGMRRPPDGGQKMAADLFSQIDSSGQGYIDKSALQAAFEQSSSTGGASSSGNVDELFSALDGNSDGKISKDEFTDSFQSLARQLESQLMSGNSMQIGNMPPPPPPPRNDAGFTKDELTSQLDAIGSSDSTRSSLISKVIENFDQADSNGDGKVSFKEAMALDQSGSGDSTTSSTSNSSSSASLASEDLNAKLMRQLMQLMQAYNLNDQSSEGSNISLVA